MDPADLGNYNGDGVLRRRPYSLILLSGHTDLYIGIVYTPMITDMKP
jgi:hypothetical protein